MTRKQNIYDTCIPPKGFAPGASRPPLIFDVFVAYPEDAIDLARCVVKVCDDLSKGSFRDYASIRGRMWHENTVTPFNKDIQRSIEQQQGYTDEIPILIATWKYRLGAGTRGEISRALAATPRQPTVHLLRPRNLVEPNTMLTKDVLTSALKHIDDADRYVEECSRLSNGETWLAEPIAADTFENLITKVAERARREIEAVVGHWVDLAFPRRSVLPGFPNISGKPTRQAPLYSGLAPYSTAMADVFFGRRKDIEEFTGLLVRGETQCLHLSGASGVGKSSLVYAGILHALAEAADGPPIRALTIVPGEDPFISIAQRWKNEVGFPDPARREATIAADLMDESRFREALDLVLPLDGADAKRVLFVDQLEELVMETPTDQPLQRERRTLFAKFLVDYVAADKRNLFITTIREDRLRYLDDERWQPLAKLGRPYGNHRVYPIDRSSGLEEIIRGPAMQVGWEVEDALVKALRADLNEWRGADWPALLSLILQEMVAVWRNDNSLPKKLSLALYLKVGELKGAIERLTRRAMAELEDDERKALPNAFVLLVRTDERGDATKRRHVSAADDDELAMRVVRRLCGVHLVIEDAGFELSHDILFREWTELREWTEREREALAILDDLERSIARWRAAGSQPGQLGQDSFLFLSEEKLSAAKGAVERMRVRAIRLNGVDDFLGKSREVLDRQALVAAMLRSDWPAIAKLFKERVMLSEQEIEKNLPHPHFYYALFPERLPSTRNRRLTLKIDKSPERDESGSDLKDRINLYFDKDKLQGQATNGFRVQHYAAFSGSVDLLKRLADLGADFRATSAKGTSAFHMSAYSGAFDALGWLYTQSANSGALIKSANEEGNSALHWAAQQGHANCLRWLYDRGAQIDAKSNDGDTALALAARSASEEGVQMLLGAGADPLLFNTRQFSPLHWACCNRAGAIVDLLLGHAQAPAMLELETDSGMAALECAIENFDDRNGKDSGEAIVQKLIRAGARVDVARGPGKDTPLHFATRARPPDDAIVRLLLQNGAAVDRKNVDGQTPLTNALSHSDRPDLARLLVDHVIAHEPGVLRQALLDSLQKNAPELAGRLLDALGDAPLDADDGISMLRLAAGNGMDNLVQRLLRKGVEPFSRDAAERTPLHEAALKGHVRTMSLLLDASNDRAYIDHFDEEGNTALHDAARNGHYQAAALLLDRGAAPGVLDSRGRAVLSLFLAQRAGASLRSADQTNAIRDWARQSPSLFDDSDRDSISRFGRAERRLTPERHAELEALIGRLSTSAVAVPPFHRLVRHDDGSVVALERISSGDFATIALASLDNPILDRWPEAPLLAAAPGLVGHQSMDQLDPEDAREVLIRLWDALDGKDVGTWMAIDAARACALPFYPDHRLVEARLVKDGACEGIISFVDGRGEISILDGKSHPMHVLNASVPLLVDTEERAIEYMRFFCANCHSDDGPFSIVTTPHELFFAPATPAAIRERAASYATPVRANPALLEAPQEDTPHPLWGFTGVVCYSNALFEANITVGKGGRIDMIDDWPIVSGMTVTAERMEGVVRKIRTIEGDDATVRFEADVNALNHAADEIAADQSGAAESGFRQVEASLARLGLDALPRYETEFRPYVQLLLARGRYADAAGWARRSLAALPRGVSEAREATAVARTVLASAAAGAGRDDAQALCDDAVEAARLADDNALLAQAWLAQAHAANTRGDMAAAREALAGIERLDPPPPPRTRRGALRLHAALLIAQADHDGAAALLARAAELKAGNENEIDLEGMILTALVSGGSGESGDSGDLAVAVDALSDESQREVDNVAWGSLDWLRPFLSAEIADALDAGRAHYDRERDAFVTATYGSSGAIS